MRKQFLGTIFALLLFLTPAGAQTPLARGRLDTLETVGVSREGGSGIVIEITTKDETVPFIETLTDPARIVVNLPNTVIAAGLGPIPIRTPGIKGVRIGTDAQKRTRVVVDLAKLCKYELVPGPGHRLMLKVDPASPMTEAAAGGASASQGAPVQSASLPLPQSSQSQSAHANGATGPAASMAPPAAPAPPLKAAAQPDMSQPAPPAAARPTANIQSAAAPARTAPARESSTASSTTTTTTTTMMASAQPNMTQPAPAAGPSVALSNAGGNSGGGGAGGTRLETVNVPAAIGGHIGVVLPLVTHAAGTNKTISDNFSIGMPVGITIHGQGRMAFDLEFVPLVQNSPRQVNLTIHPGIIFGISHGFSAGMRAAFDANSTQFGFTPLLNKSWPIEGSFFKAYFVEADLPVRFNRPAGLPGTNPVTFAAHFGLGF